MSTLRACYRQLLGFGEITATRGVRQVAALPHWIDPYVAQLRIRDTSRHAACLALRQFIRFLQEKKVVPESEPVHPPVPQARLIDDYLLYLLGHVSVATTNRYIEIDLELWSAKTQAAPPARARRRAPVARASPPKLRTTSGRNSSWKAP
jgi:hypothetical protein